jgi:hypothetical protein
MISRLRLSTKKIGEPQKGSPKNITNTPKYNFKFLSKQKMYFLIVIRWFVYEVTEVVKVFAIIFKMMRFIAFKRS